MKNIISVSTLLIALFLMRGTCLVAQDTTDFSIKYASFNIRYANGDKGTVNCWENRRDSLCGFIRAQRFDVVGAQEVLNRQKKDMMSRLPEYGYVGVGREDGDTKGEAAAILYLKSRWSLVRSGQFWLSETPDVVASVGWDAALTRICTWALLRDTLTNRQLMAVNTHFDHVGKKARRESAKLILRKIREIVGDTPFVLTGDFNVEPSDPAYTTITTDPDYPIIDTFKSGAPHYGPKYTYHGWGVRRLRSKIDYIFTSPSIRTISTTTTPDYVKGSPVFHMSDHNPIHAVLEFK